MYICMYSNKLRIYVFCVFCVCILIAGTTCQKLGAQTTSAKEKKRKGKAKGNTIHKQIPTKQGRGQPPDNLISKPAEPMQNDTSHRFPPLPPPSQPAPPVVGGVELQDIH